MILLTGPSIPDRSEVESEMVKLTGGSASLDDLGPAGSELCLDVTGWGPAEIAEALAPLGDQRIPAEQGTLYLDTLTLLHRLATHLDRHDPAMPLDVDALRRMLGDQLRRDCATGWVWAAWAFAACAEDDAERPTVSERTLSWLDEIEAAAGRPPRDQASHHAGALHTYGYLCSSLWTKYGWKRTRWVGGGVAAAAGIDPGLLQPVPSSGTLLANATTLAARLLGWDPPMDGAWTEDVRPTARCLGRVIEVATAQQSSQGEETPMTEAMEMRSTLFRRDDPPPNRAPNLLVYTLTRDGIERLVTMFDVGDDKVDDLLSPPSEDIGDRVAVRLRYNAVADGLGTQFSGSRRIEHPRAARVP